jgi:sodium-coupled neutral amino acid transporter 10
LGFHAFGSFGKTIVELCVIGYLMGTCVAFYVVIGDLSPEIMGKFINLSANNYSVSTIR